jgi:hypothetical protein
VFNPSKFIFKPSKHLRHVVWGVVFLSCLAPWFSNLANLPLGEVYCSLVSLLILMLGIKYQPELPIKQLDWDAKTNTCSIHCHSQDVHSGSVIEASYYTALVCLKIKHPALPVCRVWIWPDMLDQESWRRLVVLTRFVKLQ